MSDFTPVALLLLAAGGVLLLAMLEQAVAGIRPDPGGLVRGAAATLRQPLSAPRTYDRWLFHGAPVLLLLAAFVALAMVPWAPGFRGIDLSTGAIFFSAALAYVAPAIFMAGWGAGRPLAVVGAFRWLGVMLAYAMPLAMVVTAVAAPAESLRPADIVAVQHAVPMALVQPLALVLWLPAAMAVCFVPPFDLPQAEGELGGGVFSQYRGLDAAIVSLAQRVLVLAIAGMTATLFLAGWQGPVLPPALWMALKTAAVAALMMWIGRRVPRMEIASILSLAWKVVIPGALLAIALSGLVTLLFYR